MERIAKEVNKLLGVGINIYGFDLETGLPSPSDYRDLPYAWQKGFYKMDKRLLLSKIKKAELVLGDVSQTVPTFCNRNIAPIGFIAFDLDYYTSTAAALKIFGIEDSKLLPRVFCYFDDTIGSDGELHSEYSGELLAIKEFNQNHSERKIAAIHQLSDKRIIKSYWCNATYILHVFNHPRYNVYIGKESEIEHSAGDLLLKCIFIIVGIVMGIGASFAIGRVFGVAFGLLVGLAIGIIMWIFAVICGCD